MQRTPRFVITPDGGRIGPFWWINSFLERGTFCGIDAIYWGNCGFGTTPSIAITILDQDEFDLDRLVALMEECLDPEED
jgi:hypothetical protein